LGAGKILPIKEQKIKIYQGANDIILYTGALFKTIFVLKGLNLAVG